MAVLREIHYISEASEEPLLTASYPRKSYGFLVGREYGIQGCGLIGNTGIYYRGTIFPCSLVRTNKKIVSASAPSE